MNATAPPDLLHELPCGIVSFESDGRICFANQTLLSMLELPAEALVDGSIERILTVSSRIFFQTHFFPLLQLHGRAEEVFMTLRGPGGMSDIMLMELSPTDPGPSPPIRPG